MIYICILCYNCQYFSIDYILGNVILDIEVTKGHIKWVRSKEALICRGLFFSAVPRG